MRKSVNQILVLGCSLFLVIGTLGYGLLRLKQPTGRPPLHWQLTPERTPKA
jgi:hypothetical protein